MNKRVTSVKRLALPTEVVETWDEEYKTLGVSYPRKPGKKEHRRIRGISKGRNGHQKVTGDWGLVRIETGDPDDRTRRN